jgi:hypothetical protein
MASHPISNPNERGFVCGEEKTTHVEEETNTSKTLAEKPS